MGEKKYIGQNVYVEKFGDKVILYDHMWINHLALDAESLKNLIQFACDTEQEKKDGN